jgi:mitogen-activated protein kinase organizer 1
VHALTFSKDGKYCLTAGQDRTVRLWNPTRVDPAFHPASSNKRSILFRKKEIPRALPIQVYQDGHTHAVSSVDMDDTSTTLLSSSAKAVVVTDVITRKLKRRFTGHTARVNAVRCSSGGEAFLSASYDGTVRIWDGRSSSSNPIQILSEATDSVSCLEVVQDAANNFAEIITGSIDGCVRTYDLRKGELTCDSLGKDVSVTSISTFSERMCLAASSLDGNIHILERKTGTILKSLSGGRKVGNYALSCSVAANDSFVCAGSENGDTVIYDMMSGEILQVLSGHNRPTCSVICHPKIELNSLLVTGSYDGLAIVWSHDESVMQEDA